MNRDGMFILLVVLCVGAILVIPTSAGTHFSGEENVLIELPIANFTDPHALPNVLEVPSCLRCGTDLRSLSLKNLGVLAVTFAVILSIGKTEPNKVKHDEGAEIPTTEIQDKAADEGAATASTEVQNLEVEREDMGDLIQREVYDTLVRLENLKSEARKSKEELQKALISSKAIAGEVHEAVNRWLEQLETQEPENPAEVKKVVVIVRNSAAANIMLRYAREQINTQAPDAHRVDSVFDMLFRSTTLLAESAEALQDFDPLLSNMALESAENLSKLVQSFRRSRMSKEHELLDGASLLLGEAVSHLESKSMLADALKKARFLVMYASADTNFENVAKSLKRLHLAQNSLKVIQEEMSGKCDAITLAKVHASTVFVEQVIAMLNNRAEYE